MNKDIEHFQNEPEPPFDTATKSESNAQPVQEIGGAKGPEPTRFGDWEKNGRCIDF